MLIKMLAMKKTAFDRHISDCVSPNLIRVCGGIVNSNVASGSGRGLLVHLPLQLKNRVVGLFQLVPAEETNASECVTRYISYCKETILVE